MPRIPTALLRKAHAIDPFLPALLAPCRDIATAQNELRWLREYVEKVARSRRATKNALAEGNLLGQLVRQRASGKPLQYLLGTEYFGNLEIRCKPGVLIPRQDTAASITHLVTLLREGQKLPDELHVLDLCTGTGCIPLLFRYEFESVRADVNLHTVGVDIAERSMSLAYYNMNKLHKGRVGDKGSTKFIKADVLATSSMSDSGGSPALETALNRNQMPKYWDVLISNPPYISPSAYWKTTTRSVRGFEPKLALVPPSKAGLDDVQQGDMFYPRLLEIARDVKAKVVLLEVADLEQALRVARCARNLNVFDDIEVWRDSPDLPPAVPTTEHEHGFSILGQGNARSVVCWCGPGALWLGKA